MIGTSGLVTVTAVMDDLSAMRKTYGALRGRGLLGPLAPSRTAVYRFWATARWRRRKSMAEPPGLSSYGTAAECCAA